MSVIVLVRHGQTAWTADGRHTGRTDLALTEEGARQGKALGEMIAADRVITRVRDVEATWSFSVMGMRFG